MIKKDWTELLDETELQRAKNISNCVFVDLGDTTGDITHIDSSGIIMATDPTFSGFDYLKRSGKVLNVPATIKYYKPFQMIAKINEILVKQGDIVFFEGNTKIVCEEKKLVFKSKNSGNLIYAVPYHLLICVLEPFTNKITMLNGKLLVSREPSLIEPEIKSKFIYIEPKFDEGKSNWCKVVNCNEEERYEGCYVAGVYFPMTYNRENLLSIKNDKLVMIKKHSSFNVQAAIRKHKDIDPLNETYAVERHNAIAVKDSIETPDSEAMPYGLYVKVKTDKESEFVQGSKVIIKARKANEYDNGTIEAVGCGIFECKKGDRISFYKKNVQVIGGYNYVHSEWLVLNNSEDGNEE